MEVYVAEKPSVGMSFAKVLGCDKKRTGYIEGNGKIVTWCVGHLVQLSYPEKYDEKYKKWVAEDLPFIPEKYIYEIKKDVSKQFSIVKKLLQQSDVIYDCGDSG